MTNSIKHMDEVEDVFYDLWADTQYEKWRQFAVSYFVTKYGSRSSRKVLRNQATE